jgi:hypothetical protein
MNSTNTDSPPARVALIALHNYRGEPRACQRPRPGLRRAPANIAPAAHTTSIKFPFVSVPVWFCISIVISYPT